MLGRGADGSMHDVLATAGCSMRETEEGCSAHTDVRCFTHSDVESFLAYGPDPEAGRWQAWGDFGREEARHWVAGIS